MDLEEFDGLDDMTRNPTWLKTTDLDPGSIIEEADDKSISCGTMDGSAGRLCWQ